MGHPEMITQIYQDLTNYISNISTNKIRIITVTVLLMLFIWGAILDYFYLNPKWILCNCAIGKFLAKMLIDASPELLGIVVGVVIIDWMNEKRQREENITEHRRKLIRDMGATDNGIALRAVKEIVENDWHLDGSLQDENFERADLTDIVLQNGGNFARSNFSLASLRSSYIPNGNFEGAELFSTQMSGSYLKYANFSNAKMTLVNLDNCIITDATLTNANFWSSKINNASFFNSNLQQALFPNTTVIETGFSQANLNKANFERAELKKVVFRDSNLGEAIFWEAKIEDSNFRHAELEKANLREAILRSNDFSFANLKKANLWGTDLIDSNFSYASLQETDMRFTNLSNVTLKGANLRNADLYNAKNYTPEQLLEAESLDGANMPDDTKFEIWYQKHKDSNAL